MVGIIGALTERVCPIVGHLMTPEDVFNTAMISVYCTVTLCVMCQIPSNSPPTARGFDFRVCSVYMGQLMFKVVKSPPCPSIACKVCSRA